MDGDGHEELYFLNTDTYSGKKKYSDRLLKSITLPSGLYAAIESKLRAEQQAQQGARPLQFRP